MFFSGMFFRYVMKNFDKCDVCPSVSDYVPNTDIKWGGNRGIPTCVGAAGYQRGWESIAMCVNLPETML